MRLSVIALVAGAFAAACLAGFAHAQAPDDWPQVKCERWRKAYDEALRRFGSKGLGLDFLARNAAFMDSGCQTPPDVCPRSAEELAFANVMVMAGMNAGVSSTFMPFSCRR